LKKNITAILVEDHDIVREGVKSLLADIGEIEIIGEADNGIDAISIIESKLPDIVFMDIKLPKINGIKVIDQLRKKVQSTKFLILSGFNENEYIRASFKAGANGFLSKSSNAAELKVAIKHVLNNKTYICSDISSKMVDSFVNFDNAPSYETNKWTPLTRRETEIINLIADGFSNKQISIKLCISAKTVDTHRSNMMRKLDLHSVSALTKYVLKKRHKLEILS
jgi:DNA-binding NarL/FixJ family response regulator